MVFLDDSTIKFHQVAKILTTICIIATLHIGNLFHRAVGYQAISVNKPINHPRRSYLCTSKDKKCNKLNGSITLEAAIALPIFIVFFIALISIINIMYLQLTIQIQLEETARNLSQTAYASNAFYSMSKEEQETILSEDKSLIYDIGSAVVTVATIRQMFLDKEIRSFLDNSSVQNGSDGLSFLSTSLDLKNSSVDLVVTYTVTVPFIPKDLISINLANRCYIRLYMGKELSDAKASDNLFVYYTSRGKAYHLDKYCKYLLNYSDISPFNSIDLSLYQPCKLCVDMDYGYLKKHNTPVYTCLHGYAYHTTLNCPSFTGLVYRVPYSPQTHDKSICKHCLKGK